MSAGEVAGLITAVTGFFIAMGGMFVAIAKGVHWFLERERTYMRLEEQQKQSEKTVIALTEEVEEWKTRYNDLYLLVESATK